LGGSLNGRIILLSLKLKNVAQIGEVITNLEYQDEKENRRGIHSLYSIGYSASGMLVLLVFMVGCNGCNKSNYTAGPTTWSIRSGQPDTNIITPKTPELAIVGYERAIAFHDSLWLLNYLFTNDFNREEEVHRDMGCAAGAIKSEGKILSLSFENDSTARAVVWTKTLMPFFKDSTTFETTAKWVVRLGSDKLWRISDR
jgi:hypothetical protein